MQSKIRSLASDTIIYGVSTVVGRFLTFFLTPLYTNYLTAGEIGDVSAIYTMIAFVNVVYSLGMEPAFMRFWDKENPQNNNRVFAISAAAVGLIGIVVTLCTVLFAQYIADSPTLSLGSEGGRLVAVASIVPLLDALVLIPFAKLRIEQRPKRFALLRLASIVVTVACNMMFVVLFDMRSTGVFISAILGSMVTLVLTLPMYRGVWGTLTSATSESKKLFTEMLRFGLPTVPSSFSSIMVQVADRPIMLMLVGNAAVGMYQTNFRLALPMMMMVTVFEYAWRPFYLNHRTDPQAKVLFSRVLTLFTAVCGFVFLVTAFFMPYIVQLPFIGGRFINPAYWSGLVIVPVVMFAYYFNGVFINLTAGFHIEKRTSFFPIATVAAAVVSIGGTWLLVPEYGIMGAAWAKVAAYVCSVGVLAVVLPRVYSIRYDLVRVGATLAFAGVAFAVVNIVQVQGAWDVVLRCSALLLYVLLLFIFRILGTAPLRTVLSMVKR